MKTFRLAVAFQIALMSLQGIHNIPSLPLGGSYLAELGLLLGAAFVFDELKTFFIAEFRGLDSYFNRSRRVMRAAMTPGGARTFSKSGPGRGPSPT